jgi:hypothetical protein
MDVNPGNESKNKPPVQQQTTNVPLIRALKPASGAGMFAAFVAGFVIFLRVACDASPTPTPTPSPSSSADQIFRDVDRQLAEDKKKHEAWKKRHKLPPRHASAKDQIFGDTDRQLEEIDSRSASSISADALARAYNANEIAADEKYKGKAVIITGKIQNIGKDILGSPFVVVGGSGMLDGVQCMFAKSAMSSLASLSKGRTVTISGTVSGKMLSWVMMSDCQLQ